MLELFFAELRRSWIQFIRYPFEAIGGIFITTIIFYGLFLSAQYVAGPNLQLGDRFDSIIVGYVLWTLVLFIATNLSSVLQLEAQTGTLEQIFLSPFGAVWILLMRAIAGLAIQLALIAAILAILIALTGSKIAFPPLLVLPLLTIIMSAYGLSFLMGALALLLKRVQQVLAIFQFGLLFVLATPTEEWVGVWQGIRWLIPMTGGAGLLRDLMAREKGLNWLEFGLAFANGFIFLAVGLIVFMWCEQRVKKQGKLGGY
ncbi:MAG: ABC transporter permease [Cyanobacteriota bacterium]|nr:ABC transporter permease [Cyanobacteriota bacterium]